MGIDYLSDFTIDDFQDKSFLSEMIVRSLQADLPIALICIIVHTPRILLSNLFVTDGACMASSANQNPSLTYMALTARACHYAVDQLKKGDI